MAETVSISFRAELGDLKKQLASIPGITEAEAKKAVAALEKEIKAAEKAAAAAAKAGKASGEFGKNVTQAKEAVANLGSAVSVLSPELGSAVQQTSAAVGALKAAATASAGLGIGMGALAAAVLPVAAAVALLYAAYQDLVREQELEAAIIATSTAANASLVSSTRALEDAKLDLAVAIGDVSEAEAKAMRLQVAAQRGVLAFAQAQAAQRREIRESIETNGRWADSWVSAIPGVDWLMGWSENLEAANTQMEILDNAVEEYAENEKQIRAIKEQTGTLDEKRTRNAKEQTAAVKEQASALLEYRDQVAQIEAIRSNATSDQLTQVDAILAARDEELAKLEDLLLATGNLADVDAARAQVVARSERDLAELRDRLRAEYEAGVKASVDAELAEIARMRQGAIASAESVFSAVADAASWMAETVGEEGSEAQQRWLTFYKAASVTQILISTATAAMEAYKAMAGIPYIGPALGAAAAAAVAGVGAVQIAQVNSTSIPSYHVGGTAPDEQLSVTRPNESWLTARGTQTVGGPAAVDALNRGEPAGGHMVVYQVYRHQIYQQALRDEYRVPGSALRGIVRASSSSLPGRR